MFLRLRHGPPKISVSDSSELAILSLQPHLNQDFVLSTFRLFVDRQPYNFSTESYSYLQPEGIHRQDGQHHRQDQGVRTISVLQHLVANIIRPGSKMK